LPAGGLPIGAEQSAQPLGRDGAPAGDGHPRAGKSGEGAIKKRRRGKRRPVYASGFPKKTIESPNAARVDVAPFEAPPATAQAARETGIEHGPLYGALDLGTNNCRLLVATPRERGFRVVDAYSRIVRLGEGLGRSGVLSEAAMTRAVEALGDCREKLDARHVKRTRMIATEACRLASNREEFVRRVTQETGIALEIVSQKTEAQLAVTGCASLVDPMASGVILFDIGGGSSELVWIDLARRIRSRPLAESIRSWQSMPIGVVTLAERFGGENIAQETFEAMVSEVAAALTGFPELEALDHSFATGHMHMLGTSGTVTTLAGVHLHLPRYNRRRVDGLWMTGDQVQTTVGILCGMDYAARVAHPCIGVERADLVIAGCAILEAFRRRWPSERLRVADRGLREGMLVEMMARDGVWQRRAQPAMPGGQPNA
jgi:exopolyphosphatase/guanosine-5'-triphosphate,3'-diphosphate pyrophosphatase